MADNTRMKDVQAKVETMFTLMDNNDQRFKIIEQSLTNLPLIQRSLAGISQFIESQQITKPMGETSASPLLVDDYSQVAILQTSDYFSMRNIKIDFPRFAGSDALQWILQAEQFFYYYGVLDHHCLKITSVHLGGPMVPWFQRLQK